MVCKTEQEMRQMREEIEEAKKDKSRITRYIPKNTEQERSSMPQPKTKYQAI